MLREPYYASNHDICNSINVLVFKHKLNLELILFYYRSVKDPCNFVYRNLHFFRDRSKLAEIINCILVKHYFVSSLFSNDIDAIKSRIIFVQRSKT